MYHHPDKSYHGAGDLHSWRLTGHAGSHHQWHEEFRPDPGSWSQSMLNFAFCYSAAVCPQPRPLGDELRSHFCIIWRFCPQRFGANMHPKILLKRLCNNLSLHLHALAPPTTTTSTMHPSVAESDVCALRPHSIPILHHLFPSRPVFLWCIFVTALK